LAKVKWYNPDKRYGFVELSDGSGDDFLHATALAGIGISALQPGETLALRVAPAERGLLVTEVLSVDSSTAVPPRLSRTRFRSSSDMQRSEAAVQEMGTVKWYKANDQRVSFTAKEAAAVANRVTASVSTACGRRSVGMAKVEQNACSAYGETAK
jgi:CspA family cold shock protein